MLLILAALCTKKLVNIMNDRIEEENLRSVSKAIEVMNSITFHVFATKSLKCKCLWCNRTYFDNKQCSMTKEIREQVKKFSEQNGPRWKSILVQAWERNEPMLQNVRNILGPSGLYKISNKLFKENKND